MREKTLLEGLFSSLRLKNRCGQVCSYWGQLHETCHVCYRCVLKIPIFCKCIVSVSLWVSYTKVVKNISTLSTKDIGNLGERVAREYFQSKGFAYVDANVARKTGEIDLIMRKGKTLHFVEVKSRLCNEFPSKTSTSAYDPSANLHSAKIARVARTSEWYVAEKGWEGEWQVDALLVWLRAHDGAARVQYLPQMI